MDMPTEPTCILIVDDDSSTRSTISRILKKVGYTVETAGNGDSALDKAAKIPFNAALLDIRLPDREGIELVAPLRDLNPDIVLILATGHASLDTALRALNEGADAYVTKPLDMDSVLDKLQDLLERQRLRRDNRRLFDLAQQELAERKLAEKERNKLQAQLLQSQKMESIGRLAGGVAHDFNNMLGVILGHTELALRQVNPDHTLYADLQEILKAGRRSADLTQQLLAFARKQTIAPRVLDLNATIEGMLKMLRRLIGEDTSLFWQPGPSLWPINMDPSQIDQLLANLCVNARDAISGTGKISVETGNATFDQAYCARLDGFVPGDFVMVSVSDNGCGMDRETLDNLFEPFFTTKEIGKGTGLGLATVYGIVAQNNGFIRVNSQPGQGTIFRIYLPRHMGQVEQLPAEKVEQLFTSLGETILLVEDEPALLDIIAMMLEEWEYTVLPAATPRDALRLAQEHDGRIDLLFTDMIMPEMNGWDLAKQMTAIYPHVKTLFMSGYTADVIAQRGFLDEGLHFIKKPFSPEDLAIQLRQALGENY